MTRLWLALAAALLALGCSRGCTQVYEPSQPPTATGGSAGEPGDSTVPGSSGAAGAVAVAPTAPPACDYTEERGASRAERSGQQTKIVGGEHAPPGAYPWMVALATASGLQFCGGSLVAPSVVLTAAHCQVAPGELVVVGRLDLTTAAGQVRAVKRAIYHRRYVTPSQGYDASLLLLDMAVDGITPVDLAEPGEAPGEDTGIVIGYGRTTEGGTSSSRLLEATVPLISRFACASQYGDIPLTALCADGDGVGSCQGDSGGPLLVGGEQFGITSYGVGCARPDYAGVYGSVPQLRMWIDACVKELESW